MVKTSASLGNSILLGVLLVFLVFESLTEGKYGGEKKNELFFTSTKYLIFMAHLLEIFTAIVLG